MPKYFVFFLMSFCIISCEEVPNEPEKEIKWSKEDSSTLGKNVALNEEIKIDLFLEMHKNWKMEKTGSGLQYFVYENGEGDKPKPSQRAEVELKVSLLDGTEVFRTEEGYYQEVLVDKTDIETGIQEGIKLLKVGDKAKLIIPSHIGHGVLGDLNKIPPLTPLVVDVHLIGVRG